MVPLRNRSPKTVKYGTEYSLFHNGSFNEQVPQNSKVWYSRTQFNYPNSAEGSGRPVHLATGRQGTPKLPEDLLRRSPM